MQFEHRSCAKLLIQNFDLCSAGTARTIWGERRDGRCWTYGEFHKHMNIVITGNDVCNKINEMMIKTKSSLCFQGPPGPPGPRGPAGPSGADVSVWSFY